MPRFNANANSHQHDLTKYETYFDHCMNEAVRVEATPIYLYQETALRELGKFNPRSKIIFILREPSQRAHSQFRFNKHRLGNIETSVPYQKYIETTRNTTICPIERGNYAKYIERWISIFDRENVHVMQLEKLFDDKVSTMKTLADFLEIDPDFYDSFSFMKRNETRKMHSTKLHRLGLSIQPMIPRVLQDKVLVPLYLKLNSSKMPAISEEEKRMIETMKSYFTSSNARLKQLVPSIDLSAWK